MSSVVVAVGSASGGGATGPGPSPGAPRAAQSASTPISSSGSQADGSKRRQAPEPSARNGGIRRDAAASAIASAHGAADAADSTENGAIPPSAWQRTQRSSS